MWGWFWHIISKFAIEPIKKLTMKEYFIDVSKHNGVINFSKVKSKGSYYPEARRITGCIIRAINDYGIIDPQFAYNVKQCEANGIKWGAYLFANFNTKDVVKSAKSQAAKLTQLIKSIGNPSMPLVLDTEWNKVLDNGKPAPFPLKPSELELFVLTFIEEIEVAGFDTWLYLSPGFSWYFPKSHKLVNQSLWVADYSGDINQLNGFTNIVARQFTDKGKVYGIETNCDLNYYL